ncbi:hypothetical protein D1007_01695 [Hordeum vulgare]|nr:hypothetical protein D1007_01695 [Hordeum vulgare]
MVGDPTNPGDPTTTTRPATKKKAFKKSRSEITSVELAKLDTNSAKRRDWWKHAAEKKVAANIVVEVAALRATQHKADVDNKESIVAKAHALLMLGLCRPSSAYLSVTAMVAASSTVPTARLSRPRHIAHHRSTAMGTQGSPRTQTAMWT